MIKLMQMDKAEREELHREIIWGTIGILKYNLHKLRLQADFFAVQYKRAIANTKSKDRLGRRFRRDIR